ncbi:MAG: HAD family hydrolase [Acutalibacteraceae bacterium]|nr:HAD family hydrolase [Acutalibacteraceae bacterium]
MIKNLVFDFGRVLAYPATGNWFITPETKNILGALRFFKLMHSSKTPTAFRNSCRYLDSIHLLHTEEEEIEQFTEFYKRALAEIGIKGKNEKLSLKLAQDVTLNDNKVVIYDDVLPCFEELKSKYSISVLSDTWPSLRRVLKNYGVSQYLSGIVLSCDYNEQKSGTKLFEIAIKEWNILPEETVFVDDSESNLDNASKVGFGCILMDRTGKKKESKYPIVYDLNDLKSIL